MRAHEVDLITMVQGTKQFLVPLYQRPYSWGEAELRQLWDDVVAESERLRDGGSGSGHFIGSVVLAPSPQAHAAGGLQTWLVVDGQQRLITLMIALAAIRDHVRDTEPETAERIDVEYLINQFHRGDERLRLLPTQADRDSYRACVLRLQGADVADGVGSAYRFFRANLVASDDPDDPDDVARVEQVIRQRLRLVEITAESGDNVHRIFESLNNTGLKLSQADLLRNHLFMLLPTRAEEVYSDIWLPMQRQLGGHLELLMWLDLLLRGNDKAKQSDIYREHAERLRDVQHDEDAVVAEIGEFSRRAAHLALLLDPDLEPDVAVRRQIARLDEWGGQMSYPTAMVLLDRRDKGLLDSAGLARGLALIESYLVRRMIAGVPTNNLNRILNAVPREIGDQTDDVVDAINRYLSGPRRYWPTDMAIREAVRTKPFYWYGRGPQRTFVLRRIEESYNSPEPVDWRTAKVTIEHVMPQKLNDTWQAQLTAEAAAAGLSVDELHESLVHTLGNLTLSALNEPLSNHSFDRKRHILQRGALYMNREIITAQQWGRAEIHARAERLSERIIGMWAGPLRSGQEQDGTRSWTPLHRALALMPAGTWTTYGDLAELIGSHPMPVGVHLANHVVPNAWRVLTTGGYPSKQFRWPDGDRTETQREALKSEGVRFDSNGKASEDQRLSAVDLARLLGLDIPDDAPPDTPDDARGGYERFLTQLDDAQQPATAHGVRAVLDAWLRLGGVLTFGVADETTCFTVVHVDRYGKRGIWPLAIYPKYGGAEVVFQHLARRPPFDDPALRRHLFNRLNAVPGIALPESKLSLRPSFPLTALDDPDAVQALTAVLEWFISTSTASPTS